MGNEEREVPDECDLLRRLHPDQYVWDERIGARRPSTAAFKDEELSIDLGCVLTEAGISYEGHCLADSPHHGLLSFMAKNARFLNQEVISDELETNFAHGLVKGKKSRKICKDFINASILLKAPREE